MKNRVFLLACFFLSMYALHSQDTVETVVRESTESSETAGLIIRANVSGVEVYINNMYEGIAPLTLNELVPGMYSIQLRKSGWERKSVFVQLREQTETNLYFELDPITGFLRVESDLMGADIYIDDVRYEHGDSLDSGLIELQIGSYTVDIKKFGWKTQSKSVQIYDTFLSNLSFEMERDLFSISAFTSKPARFNPMAPGNLSTAHFNFTVTAPGSAVFQVLDRNNVPVFTDTFHSITSSHQTSSWDGRNSLGIMLPEGSYTARIEAIPAEGWVSNSLPTTEDKKTVTATTLITIDTSIFYPIVTSAEGGTSVGIPNARLMPLGTSLVSLNGFTAFSLDSGFSSFPFAVSASFTPLQFMELSLRFGAEAQTGQNATFPVFFGGSLKFANTTENIHYGALVRYTFSTEPTYSSTYSENGLGVGFIGGIEYGQFLFSASEELIFGSETGNILLFDGHLKTGLGIQYQKSSFSSMLWCSLFSPFTLQSIRVFGTIEAGLEAAYLLPNTNVAPTLGFSYTNCDTGEQSFNIQFGVNFLIL